MLSSADIARDAVARTIVALERSCLDADAAFVERRWEDVDAALRDQAKLTADLSELFAEYPQYAPVNEPKVARRVRGILGYRDDLLRRFCAYRDEIKARLSSIGKVNAFSRSLKQHANDAHLVDGQY